MADALPHAEHERHAVAASLFFLRLFLLGVNSPSLERHLRIAFVWSSMLWLTSIEGLHITTKRNQVTSAIGAVFICCRSDVPRPRNATEEPCEHQFGAFRIHDREFTMLGLLLRHGHITSFFDALFRSDLYTGRGGSSGYTETLPSFVKAVKEMVETRTASSSRTSGDSSEQRGGSSGGRVGTEKFSIDIDTSRGSVSVAEQIAPTLLPFLQELSKSMAVMLRSLGVEETHLSPFARPESVSTLQGLSECFKNYMASTHEFDNTAAAPAVDAADGGADDDLLLGVVDSEWFENLSSSVVNEPSEFAMQELCDR